MQCTTIDSGEAVKLWLISVTYTATHLDIIEVRLGIFHCKLRIILLYTIKTFQNKLRT